jgi:hypothetical protein
LAPAQPYFRQGRPSRPSAHLVHDLAVKLLVPVGFQHARHQLVLAVVARGIADRDLLLGELVVEEERILPVERLGVGTDAFGSALDWGGGEGHVFSWRCCRSYQGRRHPPTDLSLCWEWRAPSNKSEIKDGP